MMNKRKWLKTSSLAWKGPQQESISHPIPKISHKKCVLWTELEVLHWMRTPIHSNCDFRRGKKHTVQEIYSGRWDSHSILTHALLHTHQNEQDYSLLKELADEFYNTFNGQPYNLLEEEVSKELCNVFQLEGHWFFSFLLSRVYPR